jgi:mannose-1-phosphate guanylyltransferase
MRLHAVILAGGRGGGVWALSRRARPKQFLPLLGDRPMLAHTLERIQGLVDPRDLWIVTSRDLKSQAESIAPQVPKRQVIGEPIGRNTAPAMALASWLIQDGDDSVIAVLPSDHRIEPQDRFREELRRAAETSLSRNAIVTFGVPPTRPETGYGYIETGDPIAPGSPFHRVSAFREKPDAGAAAKYVADGRHLWNAGMFVFPPRLLLEEIRAHEPRISAALEPVPRDLASRGAEKAIEGFYEKAPSISIDYAVMERSKDALVARAGFSWDDLGSWEAIGAPGSRDTHGNVAVGKVLLLDSKDVIAFSEGGLVAGVGLHDLIIVRTADATLVVRRDRAQDVRAIVERLKARSDLDEFL